MASSVFDNIINGIDIKANLLVLKEQLKSEKEGNREASLLIRVLENTNVLLELLSDSDPKIRKNAALCLSYVPCQDNLDTLIQCYQKENTNYNKAAYLRAVAVLDYSPVKGILQERRNTIISECITEENRKHAVEEMRELNLMLPDDSFHEFTGYEELNECALLTNRNHKSVTIAQLGKIPHKEYTAGVMVKTRQLKAVLPIRTYEEILFIPDCIRECQADPRLASSALLEAGITKYISDRHNKDDIPFRFRVELRTPEDNKKAAFEKAFAAAFEVDSNWKFINSTSNYELEIRFIQNSKGTLNILLKFLTLKDRRFEYRKASVAASMKPFNAALICRLSSEYFIDNAAVLDPFCGAGILLVERDKCKPVRLLYGVDIFKEAIEKSHINISSAGIDSKTELITKDFFDFHHSHRFNEVITDMPFSTAKKTSKEIEEIYSGFFSKLPSILEKQNKLFIHTRNKEFLKRYALRSGFTILKEAELSKKEETYLYILQYGSGDEN